MTHQKSPVPMPSFRVVEAALRRTTEFLAREISNPGMEVPDWSDTEWRIAQASAVVQGISTLLFNRLRWQGPHHWQAFLAEQARQTGLRQQRLVHQLQKINTALQEAGIPAVALKGSALLRMKLYPGAERPTGDIDLLTDSAHELALAELLLKLGFKEEMSTERHRKFEPAGETSSTHFGEHIDHPLSIELHTRVREYLPIRPVDITSSLLLREPTGGLHPYPSVSSLMAHLLLHATNNIRTNAARMIQLHDIALLAERMSMDDWNGLLRASGGKQGLWWAPPVLSLTERYYPGALPPFIIDAALQGCPPLLRRSARRNDLSDVSWSNLRIRAFPGIEWSRSMPEAIRYMRSRIFPARDALAGLRQMSHKPLYAVVPWYGLPHVARILRWVFSNPPRVQTMYPVRMALEQPVP
jgi:hypothetical protein